MTTYKKPDPKNGKPSAAADIFRLKPGIQEDALAQAMERTRDMLADNVRIALESAGIGDANAYWDFVNFALKKGYAGMSGKKIYLKLDVLDSAVKDYISFMKAVAASEQEIYAHFKGDEFQVGLFLDFVGARKLSIFMLENVRSSITAYEEHKWHMRKAERLVEAELPDAGERGLFRGFCMRQGSGYSNESQAEERLLGYFDYKYRKIVGSLVKKKLLKKEERAEFLGFCRKSDLDIANTEVALSAYNTYKEGCLRAKEFVRMEIRDKEERKAFRKFCKDFGFSCTNFGGAREAISEFREFMKPRPPEAENAPLEIPAACVEAARGVQAEEAAAQAAAPADGTSAGLHIEKFGGIIIEEARIAALMDEAKVSRELAATVVGVLACGFKLIGGKPAIGEGYWHEDMVRKNMRTLMQKHPYMADSFNDAMALLDRYDVLNARLAYKGTLALNSHASEYGLASIRELFLHMNMTMDALSR